MTTAVQSITQSVNESILSWAGRVDTFLAALGACGVQDFVLNRRDSQGRPLLVGTVTYEAPGSAAVRAAGFVGNSTLSAQDQANAFLVANPDFRIICMNDVSNPDRNSLATDAILIIYTDKPLSNCAKGECSLTIVEAQAPILPGASGPALVVGSAGLTAIALTVNNRSAITWNAGGRGYAAPILGNCSWAGMPSCCY